MLKYADMNYLIDSCGKAFIETEMIVMYSTVGQNFKYMSHCVILELSGVQSYNGHFIAREFRLHCYLLYFLSLCMQ